MAKNTFVAEVTFKILSETYPGSPSIFNLELFAPLVNNFQLLAKATKDSAVYFTELFNTLLVILVCASGLSFLVLVSHA